MLFYDNYRSKYIKQFTQFPYSSYNQLSQISVSTNFGSPVDQSSADVYHTNYPITYDIGYSFSLNSFANRELDYTLLKFTSGVREIEEAYVRRANSPYIVNSVLDIKILKEGGYWYLKISGMDDNYYSTSYNWYIRMRFYPNANTLSYVSTTYAKNGEI